MNSKGKIVKTVYAEVYAKPDSQDDDFVVCKFPGEEEETEITDITVAMLKVKEDCLWESSKGPLFIKTLDDGRILKLLKAVRKTQESLVIQLHGPGKKNATD